VAGSLSPRAAYLLTKLAAFAVAAGLTWPLSRVVGPKAWWGLGVFGLILAAVAAVVFLAFGREAPEPGGGQNHEDDGEDGDPDLETPVEIPVEDFIDLHPFPPRDVPEVVADYLEAARSAGFREVRLIHGRGIGVQRERVRNVLSKHPLVESFSDATADGGGWGATIAYLSSDDS
jgi:hypothetical protein